MLPETITVVIDGRYKNYDYELPKDCPLFHALNEQFPEIMFSGVGVTASYPVNDSDGIYRFNYNEWNAETAAHLQAGLIDKLELTLNYELYNW